MTAAVVLAAGLGGAAVVRHAGGDSQGVAHPDSLRSADSATMRDELLAARTKGSPDAPITVLEIADFQCPACRLFFTETMPQLQREYVDAGKIRILFVNLPLVQVHRNAAAAHEFAMCAALQGRFWPVHDLLFQQQDAWAPLDDPSPYFFSIANAVGLATDSLEACITSHRVRGLILREAESVVRAGVRSTPSFVIEGGLLPGAVPIEAWRPILDSIYAVKTTK